MKTFRYTILPIFAAFVSLGFSSCVSEEKEEQLVYYEYNNLTNHTVEMQIMVLYQNSLIISSNTHILEPGESYVEYTDELYGNNSGGIRIAMADAVTLVFDNEHVVTYLRSDSTPYGLNIFDMSNFKSTHARGSEYNIYSITEQQYQIAQGIDETQQPVFYEF